MQGTLWIASLSHLKQTKKKKKKKKKQKKHDPSLSHPAQGDEQLIISRN